MGFAWVQILIGCWEFIGVEFGRVEWLWDGAVAVLCELIFFEGGGLGG